MVTRNSKLRLKTGDIVRVILGKDRGKTGKILATVPRTKRVVVEGVNMVKKHVRARRPGEKGQRVAVAAPMPVSNVQVVCPQCNKRTRISIRREGGERTRVCKKCSAIIS